jgi:structural maintenance of chromosomes protein 6
VNVPADYGIIEYVHVVNFMCHSNEKWDLGPLINFICGKNGSGKSAILTAIIICLGGKAADTNRGSSLKDLIQHGQQSASVTCSVKNQGPNAFRYDDYGDSIIIERHWQQKGSGGFKIKNATGKIMSTKRGELDEILDHLCLQIDNPLNVLSQDQARSFLKDSDPFTKYKLFLKGVLLERLDQDYRLMQESVDNMLPKLKTGQEDVDARKAKADAAKARLDQSRANDSLRERVALLRHQCIWAQVKEREDVRDQIENTMKENDTLIAAKRQEVEAIDRRLEAVELEKTEKVNLWDAAKEELEIAHSDKNGADERLKDANTAVSVAQAELRQAKSQLDTARMQVAQTKREIEAEEARLSELDGGGAARRAHELEDLQEQLQACRSKLEKAREDKVVLEGELDTYGTKAQAATQAVEDQQRRFNDRRKDLDNIRRNPANKDERFHPRMPELLKTIQKERGRFSEMPVGPIGKHIKLLQPAWTLVLEKYFGATLNNFIVTSKADQDLLNGLARKCGIENFRSFVTNHGPLDLQSKEPDDEFMSVLRALEIANPLVKKVLIIQHHIESTILISDFRAATEVMNVVRPQDRARNVKSCFTKMPNKDGKFLLLAFKGPQLAQDPVTTWTGPIRMTSSQEDQIRLQETYVAEEQRRLQSCKSEEADCDSALTTARKAIAEQKKRITGFVADMQKLSDQIEAKEGEIAQDNVAEGGLSALREQLQDNQKELDTQMVLYENPRSSLDQAIAEQQQATAHQKQKAQIAVKTQTFVKQKHAQVQQVDTTRAQVLSEKNQLMNRISDGENDQRAYEEQFERAREEVDRWTQDAQDAQSSRVEIPNGETFASLEKKYDSMSKRVQEADRRVGGSHEEIQRQALEARNAWKTAKDQLANSFSLETSLRKSLRERQLRWKFFRSMIARAAKSSFVYLLSERGFRGKMKIDHAGRKLDLAIQPDITSKDDTGRAINTLSGGEKSFGQICMVIALWEAMGSPLRCLDEFDVFMDSVMRKTAISTLIQGARNSQGRQHILISPGSKSDIQKGPDIHAFE